MLSNNEFISFEEFVKMDNSTEDSLEYIEGQIYLQASPSTVHQRISVNLTGEFRNYFKKTKCELFHAPFDIILENEEDKYPNKLIPDISVICDKNGLNEKNYVGVPTLIVEILSPSNQSHDLVTKMNLYQRFGVREYWIVNPKLKSIQIYSLNEEGFYNQVGVYKNSDIVNSFIFEGLSISSEDIF
ncbi:Uma2 family endonuclease [Clostridium grantii]|uniref:Endonuclease, Uma2 family (Restriction endonuclease fold) n=1 Tax=Clostridium grantii DSM 8605 TaxID=1121316 RepID=A0A1M5WCZ4_9CLOT|nr:Uma2 family endonuclease [Clostridium grantii]SHH85073.1 Endonuclease, Uma2 family (restriction endonuclease fold) [Clostridium grantii DSM 8605]